MNRPLGVFKENGLWYWECRRCNWVAPWAAQFLSVAYARATMHYDVAHGEPVRTPKPWPRFGSLRQMRRVL